jgi:putative transcriptional regulator
METTITHHPDVATLMCCSAGSQPEACAAVIASHLAYCPACRAEVRKMQKIGAALFDTLEPAKLSESAPIIAMRACESETGGDDRWMGAPCKACSGDVPPPLAALIGERLDDVPWRWVSPGVWTYRVPLSAGCAGDLRLFKIAPGHALPQYENAGYELTIILRGSYTDALGTYRQGDVADLDEGVAHGPVACPKKGCICLTATENKLRFKDRIPRLVQSIFGL